jgi:hypothetical protein
MRRRRADRQLLVDPERAGAEAIVRRLLAVQAQDLRAARLALRARGAGLTSAAVDRALSEDRSLVVAWLGRGTLHLVTREDYPWLLGLTAPTSTTMNRRRLGQEGVSLDQAERAAKIVAAVLAGEGPLPRHELGQRLAARSIPTAGQALPHLLLFAALRGLVVLGPVSDSVQAFALTRDWLGAQPPGALESAERERRLAELARRYLAGHGPASPSDLAVWSGLPLRDARAGLSALAGELVEAGGDLVEVAAPAPVPDRVPARLLPAFDPYLLGYRERGFAVAAAHARRVHPGGGMVRATATDDGRAVATWSARRRGGRLALELDEFAPISKRAAVALRSEAADVARFEGLALA